MGRKFKPRGKDESDAAYIKRLEVSREQLQQNNRAITKDVQRVYDVLMPASSMAAIILEYAAKSCGKWEDERIQNSHEALSALAGCSWTNDTIVVPDLPEVLNPFHKSFDGDIEMILDSALEHAKVKTAPWDAEKASIYASEDRYGEITCVSGAAHDIIDAMSDLDFSRNFLRLDLRSAMFDHCCRRIGRAANFIYIHEIDKWARWRKFVSWLRSFPLMRRNPWSEIPF